MWRITRVQSRKTQLRSVDLSYLSLYLFKLSVSFGWFKWRTTVHVVSSLKTSSWRMLIPIIWVRPHGHTLFCFVEKVMAYLCTQMDFDVNRLFLLLQNAQEMFLEYANFSEEVLVVPAPFHVVKIHPQPEEKCDARGVQSDLLRSAQKRGPVAFIQDGQLQHLPRADSDQSCGETDWTRTHDQNRHPRPPLPYPI